VLKPSARQQADLEQLLQQQQDFSSANYHHWLTPEQYADRFGVSQSDIDKIVAWLGQRGLTVKSVARGRDAISFGGAAGAIGSAFSTEIHHYQVAGEQHYSNATDPAIPVALQGVVQSIHGLHDFYMRPMLKPTLIRKAQPRETTSDGLHQLSPDDISAIYDVTPLYSAGIDGTGQKLVVVGQTQIQLADIQQFRTFYGLPANDPTVLLVPNTQDPGVSQADLGEADLDLELAGSVARKAAITFVYSTDIMDALQYAIDQNMAPVVSISYGSCELQTSAKDAQTLATEGEKANSEGMTIFAASGDSGGADCFLSTDHSTTDGNTSLSVDMPSSLPQVTGVGGTEFNEGSGSYWNLKNSSSHASALSYIPEIAWNDSSFDGTPAAGGGGASIFFPKPSWQTGAGVPNDAARDVPDVSISGSADHDGYNIFSGGNFQIIGGTSTGSPQFAGIATLLNQYLVANGFEAKPGLGNMNPGLYALAQSSGVFHDITSGSNLVTPCAQRGCTAPALGFNAGVGYDQATGLGSVDVYNLVTSWHSSVVGKVAPSMTLSASAGSLTFTGTTLLTANLAASGSTPTGSVTFSVGSVSLGSATLSGTAVATLTVTGLQLAVGPNSITAQYDGDTAYYSATATASVTVTSPATGPPTIKSMLNAASFTQSLAPGGVLSIFGAQLASASGGAPSAPLPTMLAGTTVIINGIPAPLFYVSSGQLNVQIPPTVPANSTATIQVNNNGKSVFANFTVSAAAPAVFTSNSQGTGQGAILNTSYQLVDSLNPAKRGSTYIQIYCMGLGAVSNQPASGAASPYLPLAETSTKAQVTMGGIPATVTFSGLAPGFVGEYQVNALVPAAVTPGSAVPVVVSMGSAASNTVTIAVMQ
jgi:uncharacterized protein (TIGR03437 family)